MKLHPTIGVKNNAAGEVQFLIDELENFDPNQPIYIHDDETDTYHEIRIQPIKLPSSRRE
jgi:hypothetical protein